MNPINPLTSWTNRLAFELALLLEGSREDMTDVALRNGVTTKDLLLFNQDPAFLKQVQAYRAEIRDKGVLFKLKSRVIAEDLLTTTYGLIQDPLISPAVRADLIKAVVKWAGLDPKDTPQTGETAQGVRITINIGGEDQQMQYIEAKDVERLPKLT